MIARVYKWVSGEDYPVSIGISSESYTLTMDDTETWVTLDFLDEGNLVLPGGDTYIAGIETYTGFTPTDDERRYFIVGSDINSPKQPYGGGLVNLTNTTSGSIWFASGDNYAINLVLDVEETVNVTFNVDMTQPIEGGLFVAGTDVVYTTGNFTDWAEPGQDGSIMLTDTDGDNIYTATVEVEANYGELQYKYFNNAGWDGGEWVGEPNRIANIADADLTLNDTWVVGIEEFNFDAITIAPNPFNSELTIRNTAGISQIVVSNVLGQTVMTVNEVSNVVSLSTDALNNGVYFVTFIDSNNNSRTERVVKK
jgi:hypothetical protein